MESSKSDKIIIDAIISGKKQSKVNETNIIISKNINSIRVKPDLPHRSNVNIKFYLKLPEKLSIRVASVNGRVSSEGNFKSSDFSTVNGRILVNSEYGKGKIKTVNGGTEVHIEKNLTGDLYISTVNGGAKIYIGNTDNIRFLAKTVNGSVKINHTGLKITKKSSFFPFMPQKIEGSGKSPKYRLTIKTVNGSVRLLNE